MKYVEMTFISILVRKISHVGEDLRIYPGPDPIGFAPDLGSNIFYLLGSGLVPGLMSEFVCIKIKLKF